MRSGTSKSLGLAEDCRLKTQPNRRISRFLRPIPRNLRDEMASWTSFWPPGAQKTLKSAVLSAKIKVFCIFPRVFKNIPQNTPKSAPREANMSPRSGSGGPKSGPRGPKSALRAARSAPRAPQEPPGEPQERPRRGPRKAQEGPWSHKGRQEFQNDPPRGPQRPKF